MWALLLATIGTGATSVAGGSWRWLENNEPRFVELSSRTSALERDLISFRTVYEREHQALRLDLEKAATNMQVELAKKVDTTSRMEMLNTLNTRLDQMDRHLEAIDARITAAVDRASGAYQQQRK